MKVHATSARYLKQVTNLKQVIPLKEMANPKQVTILDSVVCWSMPFVIFIAHFSKGMKEILKRQDILS